VGTAALGCPAEQSSAVPVRVRFNGQPIIKNLQQHFCNSCASSVEIILIETAKSFSNSESARKTAHNMLESIISINFLDRFRPEQNLSQLFLYCTKLR
jgi:hypothetical protein